MKFSVSSYSYSGAMSKGKTLFDIIEIAAQTGFDGIEFIDLPADTFDEEISLARALKQKCDECGIQPVAYTIAADLLTGSDGDTQKEIDRICRKVDVANELGCKKLRHDASRGFSKNSEKFLGFDDALPCIIEGCREVTEYAKKYNITTMVENHGTFAQDSERVEKIVNGVKNENFGLLVDIGNFLCVDENPITAVGRVSKYAKHVHVKDFYVRNGNSPFLLDSFFKTRGGNFLRGAIVGHGDVPVYQCLSVLKDNGYDDFVSIEFEGIEDSEMGCRYGLNTLKKIVELL